jgi:Dolichyl-phosphate-mannose-protein mannosyltransferase
VLSLGDTRVILSHVNEIDMQPQPRQRTWFVGFVAILLLGLGLRLWGLDTHSFWTDEFYALEVSSGHPWLHQQFPQNADVALPLPVNYTRPDGVHPAKIWVGQARDSHPPLYFILLSVMRYAFGPSEFVARLPSVAFSVALLAVVGMGVCQVASRAASLWVMAVLAVSGLQIGYAQEARNYAMLLAILYTLAWLMLRVQRLGRLTWKEACLLGALFYCAPLTHYLALGPTVALGLFGVFAFRGRLRRTFVITAATAGLIFLISWGPIFLQQYRNDIGSMMRWMGTEPDRTAMDVLKRLMVWSWDALAFDNQTPWKVRYISAILLLGPLLLFWKHPPVRLWVLMTWAVLGSVALSDVFEQTDRLRIWRYTLAAGPALAAGAIVAADRWRWTRHAVPVVLLGVCLVRLPSAYMARNVDYRPLASFVAQQAPRADDVIVIVGQPKASWHASVALLGLSHYGDWDDQPTPPRFALINRPASPALLADLSQARRVVVFQTNGTDARHLLPADRLNALRAFDHLGEVFEFTP